MRNTLRKRAALALLSLALLVAVVFGLATKGEAKTFTVTNFDADNFTAFYGRNVSFRGFEVAAFSGQQFAFAANNFGNFDFQGFQFQA